MTTDKATHYIPACLDEEPESGGELAPLPLDDVERDLVDEAVDLGKAGFAAADAALLVVLSPPLPLLLGLFSDVVIFHSISYINMHFELVSKLTVCHITKENQLYKVRQ